MTSRAEMKLVFNRLNSVNPFPEFGQGISRVPRSLAVPDGRFDEPTCLHRQATDGGVIEHIKETHSQTILLATPAGDNELLEYYTPTLSLRRWRHKIGSKRLIVKKNSTELSKVLDALSDSAVAHRPITAKKRSYDSIDSVRAWHEATCVGCGRRDDYCTCVGDWFVP